jgi:hypothetical protein
MDYLCRRGRCGPCWSAVYKSNQNERKKGIHMCCLHLNVPSLPGLTCDAIYLSIYLSIYHHCYLLLPYSHHCVVRTASLLLVFQNLN